MILQLYDWLYNLKPDGLVALNRAIIIAEVRGAEAGLAALDFIDPDSLKNYYLLPATRGELLIRLGNLEQAKENLERAAQMTASPVEKEYLRRKIRQLV